MTTETTERTGTIYLLHNTVTDNCYVGWTLNFDERMRQHRLGDSGCPALNAAVHKHGWEVFAVYILHDGIPFRYRNLYERVYIADYDTFHNGYNCTRGGDIGFTHTEKTRQQMSETRLAQAARGELYIQNEPADKKAIRKAKLSATSQAKIARSEFHAQQPETQANISLGKLHQAARDTHDAQKEAGQQFALNLPLVEVDRSHKRQQGSYYRYRRQRIQAMPDNGETQLELL